MMKILGFLFIIIIVVFALFGLLIAIEYLRYFKRKITLNLRLKYNILKDSKGVTDD